MYEFMKNYKLFSILFMIIFLSCGEEECCINTGDPTILAEDITISEQDENVVLTIPITLQGEILSNIVARYSTIDGSAKAGLDFIGITDKSIIFSPESRSAEIEIEIIGDNIPEEDESFQIHFYSSSGIFEDKFVTITIENDDDYIADLSIPDGYETPETYPDMTLVWSDEFRNEALNESDWTFEIGTGCPNLCNWGNNELQYYQKENVFFKDEEYLVIQAREEIVNTSNYTSSRIITQGKKTFQYGRIDIRAVLNEGQGLWPAFWMLGENITSVGWPACGEIDIMEMIGSVPGRVHGTVHWGNSFAQRQSKGNSVALTLGRKYADEFHVYSIIWKEDEITFLLDDKAFLTITPEDMNGQNYPFNQPFYFVLNIAVGGNWPGSPNASTPFPSHVIVDYIRVFQ